jgi:hypothetical protein
MSSSEYGLKACTHDSVGTAKLSGVIRKGTAGAGTVIIVSTSISSPAVHQERF